MRISSSFNVLCVSFLVKYRLISRGFSSLIKPLIWYAGGFLCNRITIPSCFEVSVKSSPQ